MDLHGEGDGISQTNVILSEMRKSGWLEMRLDPEDARKRLYKLKNPEEVVKEIVKGVEK